MLRLRHGDVRGAGSQHERNIRGQVVVLYCALCVVYRVFGVGRSEKPETIRKVRAIDV